MPRKVKEHTHKLKRFIFEKTGNRIYFCVLPDCHFKIDCQLMLGKMTICNLCGNEFQMDEYTIKLAKPHCRHCSKIKVKGTDGQNHYVRRTSSQVITDMAVDSQRDLRERLTGLITDSLDKDRDI